LDAIEQIQVATAPYDVTLSGLPELLLTQLQNQGQMNFTVRLMLFFFRNQDLTGSSKGEDIFVPSLEQTQAGVVLRSNCQKTNYSFRNLKLIKK
jgi:hypothetical protein